MAGKKVTIGMKPNPSDKPVSLEQWVSTRASGEAPANRGAANPEANPIKMKRLTLDIPEPLHKAIKSCAVEEGITMVELLRQILDEHFG